jgi:hypothetical protein
MSGYYNSQSEIEAVVQGFENCETAKDSFSHQSHLTMAVYYLHSSRVDQATESMRAGLLRFLDHHGVGRQKYHESLTIFWMRLVQAFLNDDEKKSLLEQANSVIEAFADSKLVFEYYTRELLMSDEARKNWVEPDLKNLQFVLGAACQSTDEHL